MRKRSVQIAADIMLLAESGLFDEDWYRLRYVNVIESSRDLLVHFCENGWRLGYMPSAYFDTGFYLTRNEDVRGAAVNPLRHYLQDGEREQRWPSPHFDPDGYRRLHALPEGENALADVTRRARRDEVAPNPGFDPAWYKARYSSSRRPELTAFEDYLLQGAAQGQCTSEAYALISDSASFDESYYAERSPSLRESGLDPLYHFCAFGWQGGVPPHPAFDLAWYRDINDDVREAGVNPLYHFLKFGLQEGRQPHPVGAEAACVEEAGQAVAVRAALDASGLFDVNFYLASYPDVRGSGEDPLDHFIAYGWREGRRPNPYFDPNWYRARYLSVATEADTNPLLHYISYGEPRAFRPTVYFETEWYRRAYCVPDGISPLLHFLQNRRTQRFSPVSSFDVDFYMQRCGREVGPNRDPFAHFLRVGIQQDVDPSPAFDLGHYRATVMSGPVPPAEPRAGAAYLERVRREAFNPLVHFLLRFHVQS
jgi:hypothetical protein